MDSRYGKGGDWRNYRKKVVEGCGWRKGVGRGGLSTFSIG